MNVILTNLSLIHDIACTGLRLNQCIFRITCSESRAKNLAQILSKHAKHVSRLSHYDACDELRDLPFRLASDIPHRNTVDIPDVSAKSHSRGE